jgi:formate hydrogenlyase transcriptional activator
MAIPNPEKTLTAEEQVRFFQEELKVKDDQLRFLLETSNALLTERNLPELFVKLSQQHRRSGILPHDYAEICLLEEEGKSLRRYALDFPRSKGFIVNGERFAVEGTPAGWVCQHAEPLKLRPLEEAAHAFAAEPLRQMMREELVSAIWVPLQTAKNILGSFCVATYAESTPVCDTTKFMQQLANLMAIAIENAMAFKEIGALRDKLAKENLYLEDEIRSEFNFDEIVGESPALKRILQQVEIVAPTDSTVLILGETGTGKELIARAIHRLSHRAENTFVKTNCPAIPSGLLESELFGHERGAFTGAIAQKTGRAELAHSGTLFLDEVGELPLELQPKLLRLLQEHEYERIGSNTTRRTDARIVAATNRDLAQMVSEGGFRSDLYYRLYVFPILVPPLRERREDIPALVRFFTQKYARRLNRPIENISSETMAALKRWEWPGNIRELENFIERAVILSGHSRTLRLAPGDLQHFGQQMAEAAEAAAVDGTHSLAEAEREHIRRVLQQTAGRIAGTNGAAARLGMKRTTLNSRMKKLGIERKEFR